MNPIIHSQNIASDLDALLRNLTFSQVFVLVDQNTATHCLPLIQSVLPVSTHICEIISGEKNKTIQTCTRIWSAMTEAQLDRKALFVNLGGGVIGDMGGFCASIYKRGIRFVNLPTTLLSQVDASVGGKLGVDFDGLKNHLGVFNEPETVLISTEFLATLPKLELRSGFAEIIKHGLIRDQGYFENLDFNNWQNSDWKELIQHSVAIKKSVVLEDPKEGGLRKILNFGHTIGHAIETFYLDGPDHLLHGEAIAVGMICEAFLSFQKLNLPAKQLDQIAASFVLVFGKIKIEQKHLESIVDYCLQDKKNEDNLLLFSLLNHIGDCTYNVPVSRTEILTSLAYYKGLS